MIRFRFYYDKEAEVKWLNAMAAEGWEMKRFFAGFYRFEPCEKGKYAYQIDFGDRFPGVSKDYRDFMQETGVEIVQTWGFWVILRRLAAEGIFELYTDTESSIEHYTKIRRMFKVMTVIEMICLWIEVYSSTLGNTWALGFVVLFSIVIIAFIRNLVRINNILAQLEERRTGMGGQTRRKPSVLLLAGLLINLCALSMGESISDGLRIAAELLAIILMAAGLYQTCRDKNQGEND